MTNLNLAIDEKLLRRARILARERGTICALVLRRNPEARIVR